MSTTPDKSIFETVADTITETSRTVWRAGLGVVATVEEEGTKCFHEGRQHLDTMQKKAAKWFDDLVERGKTV